MKDAIKVLICEDNKHFRESLYYIIKGSEGFDCTGALADATDILFQIRQNKPDVILMDIEMPGISGIEAVKKIKNEFPDMQILMQTVFDDNDNIFQSICAGASGYILKSTSPVEMLAAIIDVNAGGSPMTGSIARKVLQHFQKNISQKNDANTYALTNREKDVLMLLVEGKSYKMIADKYEIAYETVRSHMKNIYHKLHVESMTEAVSKAIREKIV